MSIQFANIQFGYSEGGKPLLSDFSARFDEKKITILTGASGCGKSTLLYLAAGIYPHNGGFLDGGSILVEGVSPESLAPKERCRLVGMMFQNPELQFCMDTVRNELIFCLENICMEPDRMEAAMDEALAFCEISHLKERTLLSLSGGERQKVMLACLTLFKPKWLLLDEPFANIDNASAAAIAAKLRQMHEEYGTGILAVDHRLDNWLGAAQEIRIMENGRLLPDAMDAARLDEELLEEHGIIVPGRSYRPSLPPAEEGDEVLRIEHLSLSYGKETVLQDISASFRRGKIYAIVGESGCGKSSLFGALSGICRYRGKVFLEGRDLKSGRGRRQSVGKMGFVTQSPQDQFVSSNVRQEILTSLRKNPEAEALSEEILRGIRLWRYREVSPYLLSQGQQRRLGVAALVAYDCHVLVCDEPTYAQDRRNTIAVMDALARQAREHQTALIFSTHDRQLARDYADEILILEGGELHAIH